MRSARTPETKMKRNGTDARRKPAPGDVRMGDAEDDEESCD